MLLDSPVREEFFRWCDKTVLRHAKGEGTILKRWRPRKRDDGHYDLVFSLEFPDKNSGRWEVPIPEKYTSLLDEEYDHDHDHDDEHEEDI